MSKSKNIIRCILFLCLSFLHSYSFLAQTDSTKKVKKKRKEPSHFFKTTIWTDYYTKLPVSLGDSSKLGKKLGKYGLTQSSISFYAPIFTVNKFNKDSSVNSNFHMLLSGTAYYLQPQFSGIAMHTLAKYGLGIRAIYNTGKKSIWFLESSPFVTQDITYGGESAWRMAGSIVWSYSFTEKFNFRLGATKSFLWGNRYYLPFVGIRIGKIDKVNFSAQFPRNVSLNLPLGNVFRLSIYSKPQGGVFNFSNVDTVYNNKKFDTVLHPNDRTIHFGRYELLTGFRMDIMVASWFNFYVSTGFSTKNFVAFYSNNFNKNVKATEKYGDFYSATPQNSLFFNFGLTFRMGRARSYYMNRNMYEAHDLNNTFDPGDSNTSPGNGDIPTNRKKMPQKLKPSEVQDLIDTSDF